MTYLTHLIRTLLEYGRGAKTMMFHFAETFHVEQEKGLAAKNAENTEKRKCATSPES